jgi:MFS family permease
MGLANFAMILAMVGPPAELEAGGAGLGAIGVVVALHIAAMFAPSPLTGWLSDRVGPPLVIALAAAAMTAGAALFMVAGMDPLSAADPGSHPGHGAGPGGSVALPAALILVGIGWNFGFIGGSTQLARSLPHGRRVAAQGAADAGMGAAGLLGALASGAIIAGGGLPALGTALAFVGGAFLVAAALPVARRAATRRKPWIDRVPPRGPILEAQPDATGSA